MADSSQPPRNKISLSDLLKKDQTGTVEPPKSTSKSANVAPSKGSSPAPSSSTKKSDSSPAPPSTKRQVFGNESTTPAAPASTKSDSPSPATTKKSSLAELLQKDQAGSAGLPSSSTSNANRKGVDTETSVLPSALKSKQVFASTNTAESSSKQPPKKLSLAELVQQDQTQATNTRKSTAPSQNQVSKVPVQEENKVQEQPNLEVSLEQAQQVEQEQPQQVEQEQEQPQQVEQEQEQPQQVEQEQEQPQQVEQEQEQPQQVEQEQEQQQNIVQIEVSADVNVAAEEGVEDDDDFVDELPAEPEPAPIVELNEDQILWGKMNTSGKFSASGKQVTWGKGVDVSAEQSD